MPYQLCTIHYTRHCHEHQNQEKGKESSTLLYHEDLSTPVTLLQELAQQFQEERARRR